MLTDKTEAELLALFIISALPDEVTESEAESILFASGSLSQMDIPVYLGELRRKGSIYVDKEAGVSARNDAKLDSSTGESYIGITASGLDITEAFSEKKALFRSSINKSLRMYKKIYFGIEYDISLSAVKGGSNVIFRMLLNDKLYFSTTLFFDKSREALEVYNRMDDDPEAFYNRFMTVATGKMDYLM